MPSFLRSGVVKVRGLFKRRSKANANGDIMAELAAARRVNPHAHVGDEDIHSLEVVYRLMGPELTGDGMWKCCMGGHEQELIHWTGTRPFKYIKCQQCDHVLCRWCATTKVLTVLPHNIPRPKTVFTLTDQTIYGQICPDCGMSHLARPVTSRRESLNDRIVSFMGTMCACGLTSDHTWLQFKIGPIDDYRRNPNEAWALLTTQRAELSIISRRTSPERHAQRSKRASSVPPSMLTETCTQTGTSRPSTSDGPKSKKRKRRASQTWSLRVHEFNADYDSDAPRSFVEPAYVAMPGGKAQTPAAEESTTPYMGELLENEDEDEETPIILRLYEGIPQWIGDRA